jgi:hypothetical protein
VKFEYMDHHVIALFALIGMGLDLLGGLFLAYDLFGRRGGPLRTLLRAILYCFIFIAVCSIALDWRFAVVAGIGIGLTLTYELGRTASAVERATRAQERFGLFSFEPQEISLVLLRGFCLGAGAAWAFSIDFGLLFGLLTGTALLLAYWLGFTPGHEFESLRRPHLSRRKLLGAFLRAILLTLAAALASWIKPVSEQPLDFALRYGLVVGLVGLLIGTLSGFTEWYTDNLPERRLGLVGICLIICGVIIQSVQYWISLLDVPLR